MSKYTYYKQKVTSNSIILTVKDEDDDFELNIYNLNVYNWPKDDEGD